MQKLNWLIKVILLRFLNVGRDSVQDKRWWLKNKKLYLWVGLWSLTSSYNLDLEPLGPCNSELLKHSKRSLSQMFFKIGSLKNFPIFTGKHLRWGLFLIKMQAFRPATFLRRDVNTGVSCGYCEIFKNSIFYRTSPVVTSDNPTTVQYSKVSWGICSLISRLHVLSILIKKLNKTLQKYYHVAKQFLPRLKWLITCFWFQNIFWKNISCLRIWWKTYKKHCTNNYIISHVKRLSLPALCVWSSAFSFRIWSGKRKNAV